MPESAKKKIGDFWRGKKFSQERITRLKAERTAAQGRPVLVYDKNFNLLMEFESANEAGRQLGVSFSGIAKHCRQCNGTIKPRKYIFRYKDIVCSA